jgi:hypothetical protein
LTISGGIGPIPSQDKTAKKEEMVNWFTTVLIVVDIHPRSSGKIVKISTCQPVFEKIKLLQILQFDDFGRNWSYTKSRQNGQKRELLNWFATVFLT